MSYRLWDTLSDRSKLYVAADFERAAYRLMTNQVLNAAEPTLRKDYHLVADHLGDFQKVFDAFAIELRHDAQFQFVVARPRHVLRQRMASKLETLFVLVMADLYHRVRSDGAQDDFGQAIVELPDFTEAFMALTGLPQPGTADMRHAFAALERWGLVRRDETPGEPNPYRLIISPVIADLVTSSWLDELAQLARPDDADVDTDEEGDDVPA
jgi:hypothetical protein